MDKIKSITEFAGTVREMFTQAGEWCRRNPGAVLKIPAGKYILQDQRAKEIERAVFSGRYGPNPQPTMFSPDFPYTIGLDLTSCDHITVDAPCAQLIVDGFMEPISIRNASNVTINGLSIDHLRKPFSHGTVVGQSEQSIDVEIDPATPFTGEASCPRIVIIDTKRNRMDGRTVKWDPHALQIRKGVYRYSFLHQDDMLGFDLYFIHTLHFRPGIRISHSSNTVLRDVSIYSQPGMGIVGFKSCNITMDHVRIVPAYGYRFSTNTDATHFASCSGVITVQNSIFCGHGDDAINVHNYFYKITAAQDMCCTLCIIPPDGTHTQEEDAPTVGMRLGLVNKKTLENLGEYIVRQSDGANLYQVVLDHRLPNGNAEDWLFANLTDVAALRFVSNRVGTHLARGVLCKTKDALIENNTFDSGSGTAIHITAETRWGEGIASEHVRVRNNYFNQNGYSIYGLFQHTSAVCVNLMIEDPSAANIQKHIQIENNTIICPDTGATHAISICNAEDVRIKNNQIQGARESGLLIEHSHSSNMKLRMSVFLLTR